MERKARVGNSVLRELKKFIFHTDAEQDHEDWRTDQREKMEQAGRAVSREIITAKVRSWSKKETNLN